MFCPFSDSFRRGDKLFGFKYSLHQSHLCRIYFIIGLVLYLSLEDMEYRQIEFHSGQRACVGWISLRYGLSKDRSALFRR